ncbi:uncharacterized protein LOC124880191 isoform X1 [Girardinichthys multiradiatus]|uniref:uncharacterized protein LOC124880191 isoform X1 n=1 Tax=Girardinichthys multiradiatus TaxID=208333 RepID=UPI001FAD762D|nr:uncharacterized protein LOC124880191 isoform X1 [Girardinichthys multiradiatus]XP_047241097.1 uncharacterized protein LOC124880191 isoform X1 [Girardinichthys multiradiatus]
MMDTQKDIRDALRAVLPGLSQEVLTALEDVLENLSTTTTDDLQYITEGDLLPVLKPIQARRLVAAWAQNKQQCTASHLHLVVPVQGTDNSLLEKETLYINSYLTLLYTDSMASSSGGASSCPQSVQSSQSAASLSQPSSAAISSPSLSCSPVLPTWVDSFQIPWQKLPEELIQTLERQKRPSAPLRRQMVRIIVSEMMQICKNPTKRNTTEIAERMVSRYPKSLKDVIDGDVIGLGYHSLVKQLQARIENVKRQYTPKITKRKAESDNDTDEIPAEQKASVQDTYGCVNWEPKFLPLSETVESQLKRKKDLKKMFKDKNYAAEDVKELIKSTYYTQRKDINKGTSILKLCQEWPFLFHKTGMAEHFQQLTGINLMEAFTNLDKKGERILNFLKTVFAEKENQVSK